MSDNSTRTYAVDVTLHVVADDPTAAWAVASVLAYEGVLRFREAGRQPHPVHATVEHVSEPEEVA
jgi:hypothetical protein